MESIWIQTWWDDKGRRPQRRRRGPSTCSDRSLMYHCAYDKLKEESQKAPGGMRSALTLWNCCEIFSTWGTQCGAIWCASRSLFVTRCLPATSRTTILSFSWLLYVWIRSDIHYCQSSRHVLKFYISMCYTCIHVKVHALYNTSIHSQTIIWSMIPCIV